MKRHLRIDELAVFFNVSRSQFCQWTWRHKDFPAPVSKGLWDVLEVFMWHTRKWPGGDKTWNLHKPRERKVKEVTSMKLFRRKTRTHLTVHAEGCRYNVGSTSRWEWSVGKTSAQVQEAIEGLDTFGCRMCRPFSFEGVYG